MLGQSATPSDDGCDPVYKTGDRPSRGTVAHCLSGIKEQAINAMVANPDANRAEAIKRLIEAAGGKLVSFYSTQAEGPGVLVISICRT